MPVAVKNCCVPRARNEPPGVTTIELSVALVTVSRRFGAGGSGGSGGKGPAHHFGEIVGRLRRLQRGQLAIGGQDRAGVDAASAARQLIDDAAPWRQLHHGDRVGSLDFEALDQPVQGRNRRATPIDRPADGFEPLGPGEATHLKREVRTTRTFDRRTGSIVEHA